MIDLDALTAPPVQMNPRPVVKAALANLGAFVEFRRALPVVNFDSMRRTVPGGQAEGLPTIDLGTITSHPDGTYTAVVLDTDDENTVAIMSTFGQRTESLIRNGTTGSADRCQRKRSNGSITTTLQGAVNLGIAVDYIEQEIERDRAVVDHRCRCGDGVARKFHPFAGGWVHKACADLESTDVNVCARQRIAWNLDYLDRLRAEYDRHAEEGNFPKLNQVAESLAYYAEESYLRFQIGNALESAGRHARRIELRQQRTAGGAR